MFCLQEFDIEHGLVMVFSDEATLGQVVRATGSPVCLPFLPQDQPQPGDYYLKAMKSWFRGLVLTFANANDKTLFPDFTYHDPLLVGNSCICARE